MGLVYLQIKPIYIQMSNNKSLPLSTIQQIQNNKFLHIERVVVVTLFTNLYFTLMGTQDLFISSQNGSQSLVSH